MPNRTLKDPLARVASVCDAAIAFGHGRGWWAALLSAAVLVWLLCQRGSSQPTLYVAAVTAAVLNLTRLQRFARWLESLHPAWIAAALVLAALAFRVFIAVTLWDATFDGHVVKGVPFSDADQWNLMASDFARGTREYDSAWTSWGARRPGYYLFLGSIYALTGDALWVARVVNIVLGVASAGLIFDCLRRVGPLPVAILASMSHVILGHDAQMALMTMTESLGYFATNLSLWFLVVGVSGAPTGRWRWLVFAGGVGIGVANLARPLTLLAAPMLAVFAGLLVYRRLQNRSFRTTALAVSLVCVGVAAPLAPWLARQWHEYGIVTISDNSAEMLFAATHPDYGTWSPAVSSLPSSPEVTQRYRFYSDGVRQNLEDHLGWYVANAFGSLVEHTKHIQIGTLWVVLGLFGCLACRRNGVGSVRAILAFAVVLLGVLLLPRWTSHFLWLAGSAVAAVFLCRLGLVAVVLTGTVVGLALTGAGLSNRFDYSLTWLACAMAVWFAWVVTELAMTRSLFRATAPVPGWGRFGRGIGWLALGCVCVVTVGLASALWAHVDPGHRPAALLSEEAARPWVERFLKLEALEPLEPFAHDLVVVRTSVRSDHVMRFDAGEDIHHWSALFQPRPYSYVVFRVTPAVGGSHLVFPGDLSEETLRGEPTHWIGLAVERQNGSSIELFAAATDASGIVVPVADVSVPHVEYVLTQRYGP